MKARIKKSNEPNIINLKETLGNPVDLTEELNSVVKNFEDWLKKSSLSENKLYEFCNVQNFQIGHEVKDGFMVIRMFSDDIAIGETIAYPLDNEYAKFDTILLLVYISSRLDEHDHSGRKDYFYNVANHFCIDVLKFELF